MLPFAVGSQAVAAAHVPDLFRPVAADDAAILAVRSPSCCPTCAGWYEGAHLAQTVDFAVDLCSEEGS